MFARLLTTLALSAACLFAAAPAALAQAAPAPAPAGFPAADRIVVVGGVMGHYIDLREILFDLKLIDGQDNWIGGEARLVQLGNLFGDGSSLDESVKLLMKLEKQAAEAGGAVHVLHGKTDHMVLRDNVVVLNRGPEDTVYIKQFARDGSEEARAQLVERQMAKFNAEMARLGRDGDASLAANFRNYYADNTFAGAAEFLETLAPGTEMGDWLRSRPAVIKIGDIVFSYGGVSEAYCEKPLEEINAQIAADVASARLFLPVLIDRNGPLWWTELSAWREGDLTARVEWICYHLGARAMVVGHSPAPGPIRRGRIYHVESRMGLPTGQSLAAIEIENGRFALVDGVQRTDLGAAEAAPTNKPPKPEVLAPMGEHGDPKRSIPESEKNR